MDLGRPLFALAVASALFGCDNMKCSPESCEGWGGPASKTFQICTNSSRMALRDPDGNEVYSCTPDYVGGSDKNGCADKFGNAKASWCRATGGTGGGSGAGGGGAGGCTSLPPKSRGRPVTASSVESSHPEYTPGLVTDGVSTTRWSSNFSDPQWIRIDLGQSVSITDVHLRWEQAYARTWDLELSQDDSSWTGVYHQAAGTGGLETVKVSGNARYVRLYGTARATQYGYSLYEFEVFSCP